MKKKNLLILTLTILSFAMAALEILMNSQGEVVSDQTQGLWSLIFAVLTILWAVEDARTHQFDKPFDFGFLMYVFWPFMLPYYLWSTRRVDAIPLCAGFLFMWAGPWLMGLVAYVYVYSG